jgi:hypothetical protein
MTVTIRIRRFAGDRQEHGYPAEQLTGPVRHLIPVCAGWAYPHRHPAHLVSQTDLHEFGNMLDRCPGCAVWTRRNSHTIVVRGEVFA